jgi:hypothetical protein
MPWSEQGTLFRPYRTHVRQHNCTTLLGWGQHLGGYGTAHGRG